MLMKRLFPRYLLLDLRMCFLVWYIGTLGFVKNRYSADNLRRILHVFWKSRNNVDPVLAFSLDAEKAFDKVEYAFLFYTLKKFGFGPTFTQWLQVVYTDPMATVLTNGIMSLSFTLNRGTLSLDCPHLKVIPP